MRRKNILLLTSVACSLPSTTKSRHLWTRRDFILLLLGPQWDFPLSVFQELTGLVMLCVFACVFSVFKCVLECVQRIVGWLSELECKFKINTELSPAHTSASRRHAISDCGIFKLRNIRRRGASSNSTRWQMWTDTLSCKTGTNRLPINEEWNSKG